MTATGAAAELKPYRWHDGQFELLDQRKLPQEERWVAIADPETAAEAIRAMVVRGAPAIGIVAAYGLALLGDAAADPGRWSQAVATLRAARPTAVNLFGAIERLERARARALSTGAPLGAALRAAADALEAEEEAANRRMGDLGARWLLDRLGGERLRILTHCNTGALATAGWGTALGIVRSLHARGALAEVWATETRPYWQGARLTAWELVHDRLPGRLIPDTAAGAAIATGRVDAVVVGADRIAADGAVANKIGTYTLAVLAARHGLPLVVAAPTTTIDLETPDGAAIPIEERPAEEVTTWRGTRIAPAEIAVWNPAFDVTPPELVAAIVTERGVVAPPERAGLAALLTSAAAR